MRDYQKPQTIDFKLLGKAQTYYEEQGFQEIAVPWVVDKEYVESTKPEGVAYYETLGGILIASAEHAFIQMLGKGWDGNGTFQATTPCFRDDNHDETHFPYFMKTELFDGHTVTEERLHEIIQTALTFFNTLTNAKVEDMGDGTFDIVGVASGVELGSYGIRTFQEHRWIYGTGLALPRLSYVQKLEEPATSS